MEAGYRLRPAGDGAWEAVLDGTAVGVARAGSEGLEVSVLPGHRRKGVGRCLVRAVISDLVRAGVSSVRAAPPEASGKAFCEALGGIPLGGGAYRWTDLKAVAKCAP